MSDRLYSICVDQHTEAERAALAVYLETQQDVFAVRTATSAEVIYPKQRTKPAWHELQAYELRRLGLRTAVLSVNSCAEGTTA